MMSAYEQGYNYRLSGDFFDDIFTYEFLFTEHPPITAMAMLGINYDQYLYLAGWFDANYDLAMEMS